ncbi:hypothetical protein GS944_16145 [Rhodococcus hoagii]|nr:hypothetical protein [Prescottella equi]
MKQSFDWSKCLYADAPPLQRPLPSGPEEREHPHEQEDQGRNRRRCCCSPPRRGAGTFALWSDTETVTGGTINSGTLEFVGTTAAGTWYDGAPRSLTSPTTDRPRKDADLQGIADHSR